MIVIGGSLGGCDALGRVLWRLPKDFSLPIAVVLHRHKESHAMLVPVVQRSSHLPVSEVEDQDPIEPGHVYLCPPDYHLLFDNGRFSLAADDLVNFARPSVDVLFESAAEWYREKAVAVILSGAGADGAAGAKKVKDRGGLVIVQDPDTAEGLWMPTAAITATATRHVLSLEKVGDAIAKLAAWRLHGRKAGAEETGISEAG
jgi:two-component system chemotaxis response regulator CheB